MEFEAGSKSPRLPVFLEHGLTGLTSLVMVFGLGIVPRRGAWFWAFLAIGIV